MTIYSPNMLKVYVECPKKFEYKYIQKVSVPQKLTLFEKGKKIHALANYYLKGFDVEKMEKVLKPEELSVWNVLKSNEYFNKTFVNSEYNLSCKISDFWIGGRLDAVVKDAVFYYILDYKTGSVPKNPEKDFQTMVYLLCLSDFLKTNDLSFVYIDLKNQSQYKIDFDKNLEAIYKTELIRIITEIVNAKRFIQNCEACRFCEYKKLCGY